MHTPEESGLGKTASYPEHYDRSLLYPVSRAQNRRNIGVDPENPPFIGSDLWNAWEVSWLNPKGKPEVAIGRFEIPADSPFIIESKSLKLYLNSLNSEKLGSYSEAENLIARDLSSVAKKVVHVRLFRLSEVSNKLNSYHGESLDELDISIKTQQGYNPELLHLAKDAVIVRETLISDLLKSNCPVTGQPDWGTVCIRYQGLKLDRKSLLRLILSFRNHNEFHEQCTERLFMAIMKKASASELLVECRYTRRGGLDINPSRRLPGMSETAYKRLVRQ